jgi:hypothetical protein
MRVFLPALKYTVNNHNNNRHVKNVFATIYHFRAYSDE